MAKKTVKKTDDPRPSWDEYFMNVAKVVATRSNCSRRQVAAVIDTVQEMFRDAGVKCRSM